MNNLFCFRTGLVVKLNWDILCQALRAAFNITLVLSECSTESALQHCSEMVKTCCKLVKFQSKAGYNTPENAIIPVAHLMVNMPKKSLENLCPLVGLDNNETCFDRPRYYEVSYYFINPLQFFFFRTFYVR